MSEQSKSPHMLWILVLGVICGALLAIGSHLGRIAAALEAIAKVQP